MKEISLAPFNLAHPVEPLRICSQNFNTHCLIPKLLD